MSMNICHAPSKNSSVGNYNCVSHLEGVTGHVVEAAFKMRRDYKKSERAP